MILNSIQTVAAGPARTLNFERASVIGRLANQEPATGGPRAFARTRLRLCGRSWPSFHVWGYAGVVAAIALAMMLAARAGLSCWVMGAIVVAALASFLALALVTKLITGEEQLIYYHQEIAVMLVTAMVVRALHRPVLPYLDVTILGIGTFLACGRIGCLMVGCCHGRPCPWGIRYREEHARKGFAPYLVGITLFPVQALESLWVGFVVAAGVAKMWRGQPPGSALAWYTVAYGAARFSFEFIRGDTDRPYTWQFSQGQWLSLWLMGALVAAEWSGQMPFRAWHAVTLAALGMVMIAAKAHRKFDPSQRFRILHPRHVSEVAVAMAGSPQAVTAMDKAGSRGLAARVDCTSLGIQISRGRVQDAAGPTDHYTLSQRHRELSRPAAMLLAELIFNLSGQSRPGRLVAGNYGMFHLILPRERQNGAAIGHA